MRYNIQKLFKELAAAGLPVTGTRDGEPAADYLRDLTEAEKQTEAAVLAAHTTDPTPEQQAAQISAEDKIKILWDKVFNGMEPDAGIKAVMNGIPSIQRG